MAAELQENFGVDAVLKKGHSGVYDVIVNGEVIFSKYDEGRHARDGEVVGRIRARGFH